MNKDENENKVEEKKKKEGGCCGGSSKKKKKSKPKLLSLLTIGNQAVGKTAILNQFIDGQFLPTLQTTGQEFRVVERTIKIDNEDVTQKVKIWDSSGQERFRSIVVSSAKNTNGIFLVYDVTSQKTFDDLQGWIQSIEEEAKDLKTFPFIIMANKIDLEEERVISHEQGKAFAASKKMPYFETSAKTGQGLKEALDYLITAAAKSVMGIPYDNIII